MLYNKLQKIMKTKNKIVQRFNNLRLLKNTFLVAKNNAKLRKGIKL